MTKGVAYVEATEAAASVQNICKYIFMTTLKQNWSQIYSKSLMGDFVPQTSPRGFAHVHRWGLQAAPRPPASVE